MRTVLSIALAGSIIALTGAAFSQNPAISDSTQHPGSPAGGTAAATPKDASDATGATTVNQDFVKPPESAKMEAAPARDIPDPVTIPRDGNMPGSGPNGTTNASGRTDSGNPTGDSSADRRSNESLRNDAHSADLIRCDTMTGSERSRCVALAQRRHHQM
jgi:hypothetical protein